MMKTSFYSGKARSYSLHFGKYSLHTSSEEIRQIAIAWIMISLAFAILDLSAGIASIVSAEFLVDFLISAITVGIGFLLHELGHKVVAQHYRCWAEFRADFMMLLLAVGMSFFGFIFIAPGAVFIIGKVNVRQNGIISIAGPFMNFALALAFLLLAFFGPAEGIWAQVFSTGYFINAWLGLFNMIPFGYFDGAKILAWSKPWYFLTVFILAFLAFVLPGLL